MVRSISLRMMSIMRSTPGPAAGHQPVQVSAADHGEPGAEGYGRDDVGARGDPGIEVDLDILADLAGDVGKELERHGARSS